MTRTAANPARGRLDGVAGSVGGGLRAVPGRQPGTGPSAAVLAGLCVRRRLVAVLMAGPRGPAVAALATAFVQRCGCKACAGASRPTAGHATLAGVAAAGAADPKAADGHLLPHSAVLPAVGACSLALGTGNV